MKKNTFISSILMWNKLAVFLLFFSAAYADERCEGVALQCDNSGSNDILCQKQQGCGWVSGAGFSHCAGLVHPCKSIANKVTCENQRFCSWVEPIDTSSFDNNGCSTQDFNICAGWGASCFLSENNGTHPYPEKQPPRGYKNGDQVALCWWKEKSKSNCPNTAKGGFWATASNFGQKFGWSEPPEGWGQCMSQCANIGGGFNGPSNCIKP